MESIRILFIENDPLDAILARVVFRDSKIDNQISIVSDTKQALKFLRREDFYECEQMPDLIIFDMYAMNTETIDFLREIKNDTFLKTIPVIVFVLPAFDRFISNLYALNVNCCVRRPNDIEEFALAVDSVERFWLNLVEFQQK